MFESKLYLSNFLCRLVFINFLSRFFCSSHCSLTQFVHDDIDNVRALCTV